MRFIGSAPPTPACSAPRRPAGRDAGIAGTPGWGSRDWPVASQPFSESALSPALRGVLTAKAGLCRGTGSRGSALGTSLVPRPLWSRRVAGPGPTAAPRSTGWRSCCTALVGKDGPLSGLPRGQRPGQGSPQFWGAGDLFKLQVSFCSRPAVVRRAELGRAQGSGVSYPLSGPR